MNRNLPRAHVVHALPGRTRIRVPGHRHDHTFFQDASAQLTEMDGTGPITVNPTSASFLILHRDSVEALADFARAHDLFDLAPPAETHASHKPLPAAVGDSLELADLALRFKTGGRADLGSLTFGALTAAAVVQLFRGQFLSPGVTLLHYALALIPQPVSYRELRPPV